MDITKFVLQGQRSVTLSDDVAGNLQNEIEALQSKTSEIDTIKGGILGNASGVGAMFPVAKEYKKEIKNALPCLGGSYSSATYPELFGVIGIAYGGSLNGSGKSKTSITGYDEYTKTASDTVSYFGSLNINTESCCISGITKYESGGGNPLTILRRHNKDGTSVSDIVVQAPTNSANAFINGASVFGNEVAISFSTYPYYHAPEGMSLYYSSDGGKAFTTLLNEVTYPEYDEYPRLLFMTKKYLYTCVGGSNGWGFYRIAKTGGGNTKITGSSSSGPGLYNTWWNISTGYDYAYVVQRGAHYLYYVDDNDPATYVPVSGKPNFNPPGNSDNMTNPFGGVFIDDKLYLVSSNNGGVICECAFSDPKTISKVKYFTMTGVGTSASIRGGVKVGNYLYMSITGGSNSGFYACDLINYIASKFSVSCSSSSNPQLIENRLVVSDTTSVYAYDPAILFKTPNINNLPGTTMYITTKASEGT